MSRFRHFAQGLASSWLATAATVAYSLASVPIALHYLSVEEFGLFVLVIQAAGFFNLLEVGMSASTSRILVDYKDSPNDGVYGAIILSATVMFCIIALLIIIVGTFCSPWIVSLIGVPPHLAEDGIFLLRCLALTTGISLVFRVYGTVLFAHKRLDLIHAFIGGNMLVGLLIFTFILVTGGGLRHLAWMFVVQALVAIMLSVAACHRLSLLPKRGQWGKVSSQHFRELLIYGKDIFFVNVGSQVLEASQLIIVTRTMGLTAAATWSVSTKLFTLAYQLVTKIEGTAVFFFAEMIVRDERALLERRFRQIYQLTAAISVPAVAIVLASNTAFVSIWAEPSLSWPQSVSAIVALLTVLNCITRCMTNFIVHTKNVASLRYVYFLEALAFIALSLLLGSHYGFYGILGSSLVCLVLFRGIYSTHRVAAYFGMPRKAFWIKWIKRPLFAGLFLVPFIIGSEWIGDQASSKLGALLVTSACIAISAVFAFVFIAIREDVRAEFIRLLRAAVGQKA